jgi:hypothetical protein
MIAIAIFAVGVVVALVARTVALSTLYRVMPDSAFSTEGMIGRVQPYTSSILDTTHAILVDAEPKINEITSNVAETKATVQASLAHAVAAWTEITNRARTQALRLHEFVCRIASKPSTDDLGKDVQATARPLDGQRRWALRKP